MRLNKMTSPIYLSVTQFTQKHPAFAVGGLRHFIFNEHKNGLKESGAIVRLGRKLLINEELFFNWVQSNSGV